MTKQKKYGWLRWFVPSVLVVVWVALTGVGGPYFGRIEEVASNDLSTFLPSSAESTQVNTTLEKFREDDNLPAIVVFGGGGDVSPDQVGKINQAFAAIAGKEYTEGEVVSPAIPSEDGNAVLVAVPLKTDAELEEAFSSMRQEAEQAGVTEPMYITGPASFSNELRAAFTGIDGKLLAVALSVVFVILLVVYRSPFLPFIVLFTAMAALCAAILAVFYLAKADLVQLNGQVQGILFILVIGAATDYSLLYIARYREELTRHKSVWKASKVALRASFEPIVAAGGTVTVGLLCLLFSDLGSNSALGPVGGIGIGFSILAALTLLPSILGLVGRRAFWPRVPKRRVISVGSYEKDHPAWTKVGRMVEKYPRRVWMVTGALLLAACLGVFQLQAEGVAQSDFILGESEARDGQAVLDEHFASGSGTPASIVVPVAQRDEAVKILDADEGVSSVGVVADHSQINSIPIGEGTEAIRSAPPFRFIEEKVVDDQLVLEATLVDAADSLEARETIVRLRDELRGLDSSIQVGGISAVQHDTIESALRDEKIIIPLVLIAITIILMVLLRSIVAPIILLLTTVISFGSAMGIAALMFNHVWQFPGADPSVVLYGFVFLVALGIDYNIFLMTRVREETLRHGVKKGTIKGLVVTGGVITSAGIVLAATFAALGVLPILFLVQLAFIVAFGVLLDTLVVRSLLVPALTLSMGPKIWWPLRKIKK